MTLSGKACRTFENDIPQSDGLNVRYRAYLDDEGWLRGLDTYYPEKAGEKVSGWRMRYPETGGQSRDCQVHFPCGQSAVVSATELLASA